MMLDNTKLIAIKGYFVTQVIIYFTIQLLCLSNTELFQSTSIIRQSSWSTWPASERKNKETILSIMI